MAGDSGYFLEKLRSMNLLKYEVNRVRLELADLIHCFADHRIRANLVRRSRVYFLIRIDMAYQDSAFPSKVSCFLFLHRPAYRRVLVIVLLFRRLLLFRLDRVHHSSEHGSRLVVCNVEGTLEYLCELVDLDLS